MEDFNEILNYVQYSELTDAVMNISSFKKWSGAVVEKKGILS